ncbi:MAG: hypothetical protein V3R80_03840, partial [Candidatus Tectomicrobia bacterium]
VSGKAEQRARSNAMELTRERRRWAHRPARRVNPLSKIASAEKQLEICLRVTFSQLFVDRVRLF